MQILVSLASELIIIFKRHSLQVTSRAIHTFFNVTLAISEISLTGLKHMNPEEIEIGLNLLISLFLIVQAFD
jgi:hypothetical protein